MSKMKTYHVMPNRKSGWKIIGDDIDSNSNALYLSKNNAIARAMKLAEAGELDRVVVVIHRRDGTVERKYSYEGSSA